jgi:hypothetical protein
MDTGEQAADAVAESGGLTGQVVVEPDQHIQFGQRVVTDIDGAKRVRQSAGSVGDDERVPRVSLRSAGIEAGNAAHGQTRQVGHLVAARPSDRDRQRKIVAGWSTTTSSEPRWASLSNNARNFGSLLGNAPSCTRLPDGSRPTA